MGLFLYRTIKFALSNIYYYYYYYMYVYGIKRYFDIACKHNNNLFRCPTKCSREDS